MRTIRDIFRAVKVGGQLPRRALPHNPPTFFTQHQARPTVFPGRDNKKSSLIVTSLIFPQEKETRKEISKTLVGNLPHRSHHFLWPNIRQRHQGPHHKNNAQDGNEEKTSNGQQFFNNSSLHNSFFSIYLLILTGLVTIKIRDEILLAQEEALIATLLASLRKNTGDGSNAGDGEDFLLHQLEQQYFHQEVGDDKAMRAKYVGLQFALERTILQQFLNGTFDKVVVYIHTDLPATPLCEAIPADPTLDNVATDIMQDSKRYETVTNRTQLMQIFLQHGIPVHLIYPAQGFNDRQPMAQRILLKNCAKHSSLLTHEISASEINPDFHGATIIASQGEAELMFFINAKQAKQAAARATPWSIGILAKHDHTPEIRQINISRRNFLAAVGCDVDQVPPLVMKVIFCRIDLLLPLNHLASLPAMQKLTRKPLDDKFISAVAAKNNLGQLSEDQFTSWLRETAQIPASVTDKEITAAWTAPLGDETALTELPKRCARLQAMLPPNTKIIFTAQTDPIHARKLTSVMQAKFPLAITSHWQKDENDLIKQLASSYQQAVVIQPEEELIANSRAGLPFTIISHPSNQAVEETLAVAITATADHREETRQFSKMSF